MSVAQWGPREEERSKMALFGKKPPRLASYVDVSLEGLRADPLWANAIAAAGLDIHRCELVIRAGSALVGTGFGGVPRSVNPAVLLGDGDVLAIAFPGEREVEVVKRPKIRAELQTQRSGTFQLVYGNVSQMDVWMFNELRSGTPNGEAFGQRVLAF